MVTERKFTRKQHEKDLKEAREKKDAAKERAWEKGFQITMDQDILAAGRK